MKNLFFFFLVVASTALSEGCKAQKEQSIHYLDKYQDPIFYTVKYSICDYYHHLGVWPDSKIDFEKFLKEKGGNILLFETLKGLNYGFLTSETNLIIYDFGPDNQDNKGQNLFLKEDLLNSSKPLADADISIISIDKECTPKSFDLTLWFLKEGEEVYDTILRREFNIYLSNLKNKLIQLPNDEVFVPKNGQEIKFTLLIIKRKNDNWESYTCYSSHSVATAVELNKKLLQFVNKSTRIQKENIDFIYMPIAFYEKNQLIKLD